MSLTFVYKMLGSFHPSVFDLSSNDYTTIFHFLFFLLSTFLICFFPDSALFTDYVYVYACHLFQCVFIGFVYRICDCLSYLLKNYANLRSIILLKADFNCPIKRCYWFIFDLSCSTFFSFFCSPGQIH